MSINLVVVAGRLGKQPKRHTTKDGRSVATLVVATETPVKRNQKWETETEWHKVIAWDNLADACAKYLAKGQGVTVVGRLRTKKWIDHEKRERISTEIIASNIHFHDVRNQGDAKNHETSIEE